VVAVVRDRLAERALFTLSLAMILPAPDWYLHYFIVPVVGALPVTLRMLAGHFSRLRASPPGDPGHAAPALTDPVRS